MTSGVVTRSRINGSEWTALSAPAAATRASASIAAAGAGIRRVLDSILVSVSCAAAQAETELQIRDGATGAGTVIWQAGIILPINGTAIIALSDLGIIGSANTAMTLEFVAAPAATNFQRCNMSGYNAL